MEESAQILEVETFIPMLLQNAENGFSRQVSIHIETVNGAAAKAENPTLQTNPSKPMVSPFRQREDVFAHVISIITASSWRVDLFPHSHQAEESHADRRPSSAAPCGEEQGIPAAWQGVLRFFGGRRNPANDGECVSCLSCH